MKVRIEVGSDVAKIGAWDASRNDAVVAKRWGKEWERVLEEETARGDLFIIYMGEDWGGQLDVYCDTEIPAEVRARSRSLGGEFLIRVPTGRLMVGGVEDYRSDKPKITGADSVAQIPGGNYVLRCFAGKEEETDSQISPASELKKAVTSEDYDYFQRVHTRGLLGYLTLLLYPALAIPFNWKIALPSTVVVVLTFFGIYDQVLKRSARYQRILRIENEVYREALRRQAPGFIFELRRVEDTVKLKGGSVRLPLKG